MAWGVLRLWIPEFQCSHVEQLFFVEPLTHCKNEGAPTVQTKKLTSARILG